MPQNRVIRRKATHAGSWYTADEGQLGQQLDAWLSAVETPLDCIGPLSGSVEGHVIQQLPVAGARVIIGPHAGFSYSGATAAYAYKAWDISQAKRVFLLGPSHHFYLTKAALSRCTHYQTPFGDLEVDAETSTKLSETGQFDWMSQDVDEDEHSLEMHIPYIHRMISSVHGKDVSKYPLLVPIMIGNTSARTEQRLGEVLAPYLADPTTAFVISSDFAHWGTRFRYTYYQPSSGPAVQLSAASARKVQSPAIHESIKAIDFECMAECEGGRHDQWLSKLEETGNTVCGRHPIGVIMAAIEVLRQSKDISSHGEIRFVKYDRSSLVETIRDSSVSYASAFAVV